MRSRIAGALVSDAATASLVAGGSGATTVSSGAATRAVADTGAATVRGCSGWAEGRAQPSEKISPAATNRLHCRAKLVFICLSFVAPHIVGCGERLNLHYRLA